MPGRTIKDWRRVPPSVDRDLNTLFLDIEQQSIVITSVVQNTTAGTIITTPVEVVQPTGGQSPGTSDDPLNPANPNGAAPIPTGVPNKVEYSAVAEAFVPATGTTSQICFVPIPTPMTVERITISFSKGAADFTGTAANAYLFSIISKNTNKAFDKGSLYTTNYPVWAEGTNNFPGQFVDDGAVDANDQLYLRIAPIGTPTAIGSRNYTLTIYGVERIPLQ
ncbi:MAG: hypothetical protein MN733_21980 [Nitrososphaera sp.]|nr:hypothetical protein [Nitrososphaera sp.]